jgi:hypothetical protein
VPAGRRGDECLRRQGLAGVVRRPGSIPMVGNHEREFSNRIFPEEWPSLFGFVGKSVVRKNGTEVPEVEAWDAWRPEEIADRQA